MLLTALNKISLKNFVLLRTSLKFEDTYQCLLNERNINFAYNSNRRECVGSVMMRLLLLLVLRIRKYILKAENYAIILVENRELVKVKGTR